ncbi:unnamed protein product [Toxocara canis]|uniref:GLOBIN domain-containing protein n=1 Tax=Toxocara canis TaxID=6265 RepID=A0A183VHK3_TOXCA|nr:unnamed protein product [Toxocara canis]
MSDAIMLLWDLLWNTSTIEQEQLRLAFVWKDLGRIANTFQPGAKTHEQLSEKSDLMSMHGKCSSVNDIVLCLSTSS